MNRQFTEEEANTHNALIKKAWNLIEEEIILNKPKMLGKPGFFAKRRLLKALELFKKALLINPEGWSSMWAIGKIYQRLANYSESFYWFRQAIEINPTHPDVARETSLAAMDVGEFALAIKYCEQAILNSPNDFGLLANLSLAHLFGGDLSEAEKMIIQATQKSPNDEISFNILQLVKEVKAGKKSRPKTIHEIQKLQ